MRFVRKEQEQNRRRGAAAVMVVVTVPVLVGMAALTVDVAVMYNTRADLQRTADSAALAAASSLLTDSMLALRLGSDDASNRTAVEAAANARAVALAALNPSLGKDTTYVADSDIIVGYLDLSSATSSIVPNPASPQHLNAVQVTVRRSADSANGAVGFFFAPIFGAMSTDITATATGAFDNRVLAYDVSSGWLVPFTIDQEDYQNQLALGTDHYRYDESGDDVESGADEIPEVNLYPIDAGAGNFGLLNIPASSPPSTPELETQIREGVSADDVEADIGRSELTFEDEDGDPITYTLSGNPGLTAALESAIEARVGEVIGFLLHDKDGIGENGSNLTYPIVGLQFGRVMAVELNGKSKYLWIQPASFSGPGLRLRDSGTSTLEDTAGLVVLAR